MYLSCLVTALFLLFPAFGVYASAYNSQYWQLTFSYNQTSAEVERADLISPQHKSVRTPGLDGAPIRITYDLEWLDSAGNPLSATSFDMPLGARSAPSDGGPCQLVMPEAGAFVVRVEGPRAGSKPASVRLTRASVVNRASPALNIPPAFQPNELVLPIRSLSQAGVTRDGPVSATKIRNTGADRNRLVIVILGDGYTAANLATGGFTQDANNLVTAFLGRSPWDIAFAGTNVYRVDVESNQQGADNDPYGTYVDTYFNSSFWVQGIARLLCVDGIGAGRAYAAADAMVGVGVWDEIFILVNSTTYGGSGGGISVSSVNSLSSEVVLHEFGHTFAGLADEYTTAYPGYPAGDPEPNVDYDYSGSGLKWHIWVEPTTPLPTPDLSQYNTVVGAFVGARYLTSGIYRPMRNCLMRNLGAPFDPVCKEAHLLAYTSIVALADTVVPAAGSVNLIPKAGLPFTISPVPIAGLMYTWTLNQSPVAGAGGSSINFKTTDLYALGVQSAATLSCKVTFPTPLVRLREISQTFNWTVVPDCNANGIIDILDIQRGTSLDLNHNGVPDECEIVNCCVGTVGNVDGDPQDMVDISDMSTLTDYLFLGGSISDCHEENDIDGNGVIDISDLSVLADFLFSTGSLRACP
jgi:hypothetical protein